MLTYQIYNENKVLKLLINKSTTYIKLFLLDT